MNISKEIKKILIDEEKDMRWLAEQFDCTYQNINKKIKLNNWRTNDLEFIAKSLGYELKIEFIKKES